MPALLVVVKVDSPGDAGLGPRSRRHRRQSGRRRSRLPAPPTPRGAGNNWGRRMPTKSVGTIVKVQCVDLPPRLTSAASSGCAIAAGSKKVLPAPSPCPNARRVARTAGSPAPASVTPTVSSTASQAVLDRPFGGSLSIRMESARRAISSSITVCPSPHRAPPRTRIPQPPSSGTPSPRARRPSLHLIKL